MEQMSLKAGKLIPDDVEYATIETMAKEARDKLSKFRPKTLGQASRIGGVNPSDIQALLFHIELKKRVEREKQRDERKKRERADVSRV